MIIAEFYNFKTQKMNYLLQTKEGQLITYALDKDGLQEFDKEEIINLINDLKLNKRCFKISNYHNYEVYLDPKYNIKHFLKNGIEDYKMLRKINFYNSTLYKNKKHQKNYFLTGVLIGSFSVFLSAGFLFTQINSETIENALSYVKSNVIEENIELPNISGISADDIVKSIENNPNLTDEEKELFIKRDFFEDILPYYDSSFMKYELYSHIDGLNIEYFTDEEEEYVMGYYSITEGKNTIHIRKYLSPENDKKTKCHEYGHIFQDHTLNIYKYLSEAVNEIMCAEYFYEDGQTCSYPEAVNNIKLLMDIIGTKPVLKTVYSGNGDSLLKELKKNLSNEDYIRLLKYLMSNPFDGDITNNEVRSLLLKLYQNKYNRDIHEDPDIQYSIYYENENVNENRIYFNKRKMSKDYSANKSKNSNPNEITVEDENGQIVLKYKNR